MTAIFKKLSDRLRTDVSFGRMSVREASAGQRLRETAPPPRPPAARPAPPLKPRRAPLRALGWAVLLPLAVALTLSGCGGNTSPILGLTGVSLNPTSVKGGTSVTATVALSTSPPAGGAVVTLASSNPTVAPVPGSILVAAGTTTATFTITTTTVTANTTVTIFGAQGGFTGLAALTVTP